MNDLIEISLRAHQKYVTSRMDNSKNVLYYNEMFNVLLNLNPDLKTAALIHVINQLRDNKFWPSRELKYKKLAVKHYQEVVQNLSNRLNGKLHAQS